MNSWKDGWLLCCISNVLNVMQILCSPTRFNGSNRLSLNLRCKGTWLFNWIEADLNVSLQSIINVLIYFKWNQRSNWCDVISNQIRPKGSCFSSNPLARVNFSNVKLQIRWCKLTETTAYIFQTYFYFWKKNFCDYISKNPTKWL